MKLSSIVHLAITLCLTTLLTRYAFIANGQSTSTLSVTATISHQTVFTHQSSNGSTMTSPVPEVRGLIIFIFFFMISFIFLKGNHSSEGITLTSKLRTTKQYNDTSYHISSQFLYTFLFLYSIAFLVFYCILLHNTQR